MMGCRQSLLDSPGSFGTDVVGTVVSFCAERMLTLSQPPAWGSCKAISSLGGGREGEPEAVKFNLKGSISPEAEGIGVYDPARQKPVEIKAPPQASCPSCQAHSGSLLPGPAESALPLGGEGARGRCMLRPSAGLHLFPLSTAPFS